MAPHISTQLLRHLGRNGITEVSFTTTRYRHSNGRPVTRYSFEIPRYAGLSTDLANDAAKYAGRFGRIARKRAQEIEEIRALLAPIEW